MIKLTDNNGSQKIKFSNTLLRDIENLKHLNWLRKVDFTGNLNIRYKILKKEIDKKITKEKQEYFNRRILNSTNKTRESWKIINNLKGSSKFKYAITTISSENKIITDRPTIANIFGNYLSSIVDDTLQFTFGNNISNSCTTSHIKERSMFFRSITKREVENVISRLPAKKSTGLDEVPVTLIKHCSSVISEPLSHVLNKSVVDGEFPELLKVAVVVPIFKKGDTKCVENYRPIALLSIFSKIMEKLVFDRIFAFLNSFNILTPSQHGFRANHSTETAAVDFMQFVYDKRDHNEYIMAIFFDLSRAFDTVDKVFVSSKLYNLGIRGNLNEWIQSYLTNRHFIIKIGNTFSDTYSCDTGTPQGSVLGPLLFLIYMNDLPECLLMGNIFMYADDTTVILSDSDPIQLDLKIGILLNDFNRWCFRNRLIINHSKTQVVNFTSSRKPIFNFSINFNSHILQPSKDAVFLGITVDSDVSWHQQIDNICKKLNKQYYLLCSLKASLGEKSLMSVYYANVHSILTYGIIVWGQACAVDRVFIIQKRILRLLFGLSSQVSCRECFKCNSILTLTCIYLFKLLTYVFRNQLKFKKKKRR